MIDLMPSAIHTRKPCGPARFGPMRDCMRAETRRSTQVMMPAVGAMKSRMIAAAIAEDEAGAEQIGGRADVVALERDLLVDRGRRRRA